MSTTTRDDILRKVQALLRLAEGSDSAAESAAALAKAMRMMDEHGIDTNEAREFIPSDDDFQRRIKLPRKWDRANVMAMAICEQYFHVKCQFHGTDFGLQMVISGQEHRVLFACHVFELLRRTACRLWLKHARRSRKRTGRISFLVGFGRGICLVLNRERESYTGNMKELARFKQPSELPSEDTKKFFDDLQKNAAYQHGLAHGLAVRIRQPIEGNSSSDQLQLTEAVA